MIGWLILLAVAFLSGGSCAATTWILKDHVSRSLTWFLAFSLAVGFVFASFFICLELSEGNVAFDSSDADVGPTVFFAMMAFAGLASLASFLGSITGIVLAMSSKRFG